MARDQFYDVAFAVGVGGAINAVDTARATVYLGGTVTPATIYVAESGATPQTNPWIPGDGIIIFWAESGNYDVKIEDTAGSPAFTTRIVRFSSVSGGTNGIASTQLPATIPSGNLPTPFTSSQLDATTVTNKLWSVGDLKPSAAASPQTGWLLCDGSAVSRTTYSGLFSVVGTTWGTGDGSTTFNVPDLRGRTLIGVGTGSGLSARAMAASGGAETHPLSTAELPAHAHTFQGESLGNAGASTVPVFSANKAVDSTFWDTATTGSGSSHQNMPPFKAVNFFIKV
jgi:microcystin-dependent protein